MNTPLWWGISSAGKLQEECRSLANEYDKLVMPVEHVANGIVKILEDDKNGSALKVQHGKELQYHEFKD